MKKTCFVIMGFGEKPDLATGRTLDLDKTYRLIIKRAVEDAKLEMDCARADEIIHSGTIDKPMYERLLTADLVIADLSTSNANALYELGVRHALRPHTTIVIAEKLFKFPFDISHLLVRQYEHLGRGIDGEEAERMRKDLAAAIRALMDKPVADSPVYTFLPELQVPARLSGTAPPTDSVAMPASASSEIAGIPFDTLLTDFQAARRASNWSAARPLLEKMLQRRPGDTYLLQQKALVTYKGKQPNARQALLEAREILRTLGPATTTDAETLGLWGAVHKRLWELDEDRAALDVSIQSYEKGFLLRNDHYNGINLAFMLNTRAAHSSGRDAVADVVVAERVRVRVIPLCRALLDAGLRDDDGQPDSTERFWVQASLLEAYVGSGRQQDAQALDAQLRATAPEGWMIETMDSQITKLKALIVTEQQPVTAGSSGTAPPSPALKKLRADRR